MAETSSGIYISAPGKAILFGEHAVVYGRTAVAGSIDLRTYVSLFTSQDGRIYLSLPGLGIEKTWLLKELVKAAEKLGECDTSEGAAAPNLETIVPVAQKLAGASEDQTTGGGVQNLAILAFWYLMLGVAQRKKDILAVKVTVRFKLPSCVGLGSSGAYCVCIAASLLQAAGLIPRPTVQVAGEECLTWKEGQLDMIRKWAASAESLIHGRASGLDAAVCTYGGLASFRVGIPIQHLKNLPDLKVILVNSKVERSTSRMVATVKEKLKKFPQVVEGIFNAMDAISVEAVKILNRPPGSPQKTCSEDEHHSLQESSSLEDYSRLNDLSRINNHLLIALGVGHPKIDQICTTLSRYGIHPKMTGAGGGGSVFAFLKPGTADISATIMEMIVKEITEMGYEIWQPTLGGAGVMLHTKRPETLSSGKTSDTSSISGVSDKLSDGSLH